MAAMLVSRLDIESAARISVFMTRLSRLFKNARSLATKR
jgi:hypothetical protein